MCVCVYQCDRTLRALAATLAAVATLRWENRENDERTRRVGGVGDGGPRVRAPFAQFERGGVCTQNSSTRPDRVVRSWPLRSVDIDRLPSHDPLAFS